MMRPCLAAHADGELHSAAELREKLADMMGVTEEEKRVMIPSGSQPAFNNKLAWSVTHLKQAGLLVRPSRGITQITDRGRKILAEHPDRVDMGVLLQFQSMLLSALALMSERVRSSLLLLRRALSKRRISRRSKPSQKLLPQRTRYLKAISFLKSLNSLPSFSNSLFSAS